MTKYQKPFAYIMLLITVFVSYVFVKAQLDSRAEVVSVDSGPNFLITSVMILIIVSLISFTLYLFGFFRK